MVGNDIGSITTGDITNGQLSTSHYDNIDDVAFLLSCLHGQRAVGGLLRAERRSTNWFSVDTGGAKMKVQVYNE